MSPDVHPDRAGGANIINIRIEFTLITNCWFLISKSNINTFITSNLFEMVEFRPYQIFEKSTVRRFQSRS